MIEQHIGTTLVDRRRKPVTLMPGVRALENDLRVLSAKLHEMRQTLKRSNQRSETSVVVVCQHALTTTVSPLIVRSLTANGETPVRVRAGNRDECLLKLVSKAADFAIMYAAPNSTSAETGNAFDVVTLGSDVLVPVCTPSMCETAQGQQIPTISYPADVFLGQLFGRTIAPRIPNGARTFTVAETALTLAMLQFALDGNGVAWLPLSLTSTHIGHGDLTRLDDILPAQDLDIRMIRLAGDRQPHDERIWQHVINILSRTQFTMARGMRS